TLRLGGTPSSERDEQPEHQSGLPRSVTKHLGSFHHWGQRATIDFTRNSTHRSLLSLAGLLTLSACSSARHDSSSHMQQLVRALQDDRPTIRRQAVDIFIDLAPDTQTIQPELRRALK